MPWTVFNKEGIMLVLSRRLGETVVIDGGIRLTVLSTQNGRVRLGIEAPDCVRVDRAEVHERRLHGELTEWCGGEVEAGLVIVPA
jgi:carbon storage regulator